MYVCMFFVNLNLKQNIYLKNYASFFKGKKKILKLKQFKIESG